MHELKQTIRFCRSSDGTRIAYATMGKGPPVVWGPHFLTHLEFDLRSPVWRPWLTEFTRHNSFVRYDARGCGLSDHDVADLSFESSLADLEAVVDAARLDRFALLGISQGSAAAIAFAARHPERVTRLVIYGGYARGFAKRNPSAEQVRAVQAMLELVETGWGLENPAYRQMFTSIFIPDATPEQAAWFNEQERTCTTPAMAARIIASFGPIDVTDLAQQVRCPTLVMHVRHDARVPFDEGRLVASLVPGARFVPLEGRNHVLLEGEPAFAQMFATLHDFLRSDAGQTASAPGFSDLTQREREIRELVAHGLDNAQIGARLAHAAEDVVFLARGAHLDAIRTNGLRVETPKGEIVIRPAQATDDPKAVGAVDAVFVCVKTWQVPDAAEAIRPMIGPNTVVVPLQNGVEAPAQLAAALGAERVLGGLCGTLSQVVGPGRIRSIGEIHFVKFGELDNRKSKRAERLRQAFERAGVKVEVPADIHQALWGKFVLVSSFGGVGAVARAPLGVLRSIPETRVMLERCLREAVAVARARGIGLPEETAGKTLGMLDSMTPAATTSLQRDIADGKPSELDAWTGAAVRLGRESGVPTPTHEFIYSSLLPAERRARGEVQFPT